MSESWEGLFMDSSAHLLSFSTPTHTHGFDSYNDGYGHSKTTFMRSVSGQPEIRFFNGFELGFDSESMRIMILKIVVLLDGLGSLMICTHGLIVLTKTKENNLLLRIVRRRW
jgi:hypothetical protein